VLIRNAELLNTPQSPRGLNIPAAQLYDIRCVNGRVVEISSAAARSAPPATTEPVIDAAGALLLPGLHDHHIHLFATAAAQRSVDCERDRIGTATELADAIISAAEEAPGSAWVRAVNYHERTAGGLDRTILDRWVRDRPVRIQHATGKMWFLNSAALAELDLNPPFPAGVQCDLDGKPNGRFFRLDSWLGEALDRTIRTRGAPELQDLSAQLTYLGITGVTDTSADNADATLELLRTQQAQGFLQQRVRAMGNDSLSAMHEPNLQTGELKILLDEYALPDIDALIERIRRAHELGRGVAFHCVTHIELVFALSALASAGTNGQGIDRIEHASVVTDADLELLQTTNVTVVTQPGLVASRGDNYRAAHDAQAQANLYRCATLINAGIPTAAGSDAPYGPLDPWLAMRTAVDRKTESAAVLGGCERVSPEQALAMYLGAADKPAGGVRTIAVGGPADFCLLHLPWQAARKKLNKQLVRQTFIAGRPSLQQNYQPATWP